MTHVSKKTFINEEEKWAQCHTALNIFSVHFRNLCLLLHFHPLHAGHHLVELGSVLILVEIQLTKALIGFQILTCCLLFLFSALLPLPLVHVQQILAANSVNSLVSFEALFSTVVLGQAMRPEFKRIRSQARFSSSK